MKFEVMDMQTFDRLVKELEELQARFDGLSKLLGNKELLNKIDPAQVALMKRQRGLMGELLTTLVQRKKLAHIALEAEAKAKAATAAQQLDAEPEAEAKAVKKAPAPRKRTTTKKKASTTESEQVE